MPCYNVRSPEVAINLTRDIGSFKLYLSDIGLFVSMIFNSNPKTSESIYGKLIGDKLESNLGYLYENAVAQAITSHGRKLYYHYWREEGKTHPYEVDFLLIDRAKLIPVEVKSSNINNHKSIEEFCAKYSHLVSRRIMFSQYDISNDGMLELKPIYSAQPFLSGLDKETDE